MRNRWLTTEVRRPEYYRGLLIHADTGLHDQMAELVKAHLASGSKVVDLGAGAGAFTRRLLDLGYRVTPIDSDPGKWALPDVPLRRADLEAGIPDDLKGAFDGAIAMEVIEHVENPWQFFRHAEAVLKPGGLMFLSTPNVASFYSRAIFLVRGRLHQFDDADIEYGHINPILTFELETIARRQGWRVKERRPGGYLPVFDFSNRSPRAIPGNLLRGIAYLLSRGGTKEGWCVMFVLERPNP